MKTVKLPCNSDRDHVIPLLESVQDIFQWKGKKNPEVIFALNEIKNVDVLGLLLIYKVIEFCVERDCITRSKITGNKYIKNQLKQFGFWKLLTAYLQNADNVNYGDLDIVLTNNLFIAPFPLLRDVDYDEKNIRESFLPQIEAFYRNSETDVSSVILQCFSEILLNFWEHAVTDTKSIIIANGNKDFTEIACADTGSGIVSTLKPILEFGLKGEEILLKSLDKYVTSKRDTNHMGCGLWLINQVVNRSRESCLHLFSEGYYVRNCHGNVETGKCAYWQGTIIYVYLDISSLVSISQILNEEDFTDININFQ